MRIYCATTNRGKLREFQLAGRQSGAFEVEQMPGLRDLEPAEETGATFRENAIQKALYYSARAAGYLFVDDSGLEVDALGGAPGVYSARYAGEGAGDAANNALLLERMRGVKDRGARFVCVVALARDGELVETFEATVEGELLEGPRGEGGFGYDPLFFHPPFGCTLSEASEEQKIEVSHRGKALRAMFRYLSRCGWARNELAIRYHDIEWGVPVHDDRTLFEFLILEGAQAGLSWDTILRKRESYREAFDGFDAAKVARYDAKKVARLLANEGIVRNRLKVASAVDNAKAFLEVRREFGSFDAYVWSFVGGAARQNSWGSMSEVPARTAESDAMSKDLRKRGFRFVGSTICYAFMQAVGMVNDHLTGCFRHAECARLSSRR